LKDNISCEKVPLTSRSSPVVFLFNIVRYVINKTDFAFQKIQDISRPAELVSAFQ